MLTGVAALSEREKEVLRLLLRGHDAKSIANELDLSIHTVNEHLREARRKLGVSSSREAARTLGEVESGHNSLGDKEFGIADDAVRMGKIGAPDRRFAWFGGGMLTMSLLIAAAAIAYASHTADKPRPGEPPKVVSSNPKPGATIRPGPLLLSVTYDRPMRAGSASFAGDLALFPENCLKPEQSKDGRSYSMRCTVSPGRRYEVWFNRGQYMNFRSTEGISGEPYQLIFDVSR